MGHSATWHGTGEREVTFRQAQHGAGLIIDIDSNGLAGEDTLYLYMEYDKLADLLVELSTWPEVVTAAGERFREAILGHDAPAPAPELSPVAVNYFRGAFNRLGYELVPHDQLGGVNA